METIKELEQKIKCVHEEEFVSLKNLYKEFMESDKTTEYAFECLIQRILIYAFDITRPKAFYKNRPVKNTKSLALCMKQDIC